jgi:ABC-2 type transport system ATP-binding protein
MLQAINISQGYGRSTVVHDFNASFGQGIYGILGPNGAGKTTLLSTLATLRFPSSGELKLHDRHITPGEALRHARRRISFLPQGFGYPAAFTVRDFLAYSAWVREVPVDAARSRSRRVLEQLDLTSIAQKKLRTLSGGTLQRAGIAQALMSDPEVLILDEPTVGLDPAQRLSFRQLLAGMSTERCILLSTHLVEDVTQVCEQVIVLNGGKSVFSGSPSTLSSFGGGESWGVSAMEAGYLSVLQRTTPPGIAGNRDRR